MGTAQSRAPSMAPVNRADTNIGLKRTRRVAVLEGTRPPVGRGDRRARCLSAPASGPTRDASERGGA